MKKTVEEIKPNFDLIHGKIRKNSNSDIMITEEEEIKEEDHSEGEDGSYGEGGEDAEDSEDSEIHQEVSNIKS